VFVCYSHSDSEPVYSDLEKIHEDGQHVWYDEGIPAGSSWRGEIAAAIKGATKFLFFISEKSLTSPHCLREVDYALSHDIEILPIYLDDSSLPGELELVLNRVQALYREKDTEYIHHLLGGLRKSAPLSRLVPKAKKPGPYLVWPALALVVGLLSLVLWNQWGSNPEDRVVIKTSDTTPNAYDTYLEGKDLLERWDKDDNLDRAIGLFRESTRLDPGFALAFAQMAEGLRIRYALTSDETSLEEVVSAVDTAVRLNPDLAPVQVALGRVHTQRGNIDLAFAALERALEIDANDASANLAIAKLYTRLGRLEDAAASFKKAVALDPDNTSILNSYANFLYDQGRIDEATQHWQTVIRLAPEHYAALVNLGAALEETDRVAEAITMYQRSIEIRPSYMAWSNLGTAYARDQRYLEAVEAYLKALEIDDSDSLAWGNLAFVYSWMNGMDRQATETFEHAILLAEAAREQNPREAFVYSDLGLYYAMTEQPKLALQRLETAIILAPETAEILAAAAETYEFVGQRDKAVEFANKALALGLSIQHFHRNPDLDGLMADPRIQVSP